MADDLSPTAARAALASATDSADKVRVQARWMSTYLAVFAAGFGALTLLLGLVEPLGFRIALFSLGWPALIVGMVWWSARRPASLRGTHGRVAKYWIGTGVLYGIALLVGTPRLIGQPLYWIPAAALVATPMLIGALRERRA